MYMLLVQSLVITYGEVFGDVNFVLKAPQTTSFKTSGVNQLGVGKRLFSKILIKV